MRDDRERLLDILEAIESIEKYVGKGHDAFLKDELVQVWIVHHIQVIGEAAARLSSALRENHPEIPWADIISMRNVVVHQYFGIDLNQIWDTATLDVPALKLSIEKLLSMM
jgi:uncharacterized protein with HEPN domain